MFEVIVDDNGPLGDEGPMWVKRVHRVGRVGNAGSVSDEFEAA